MGTKLKLTLKGFDGLLEEIQSAGGEIAPATERALQSSAKLLTNDIKSGAAQRNVPTTDLINPTPKWSGNRCSIEVGFKLGAYDSVNPSSGYLALFKEYGAPAGGGDRTVNEAGVVKNFDGEYKTLGMSRGAVKADPFIRPALEQNQKAIREAQKTALERILGGLKS